ncbi:MAG: hypothetical protein AUJ52_01810 [Elusimicrobia bacterium CG1_02_63_36]|nr:MAG: hypothetical protein AUJ52_01810 [Elusimicrobia bacterium CG1_02_63_36]PIP82445.1 MAG: hypothetical protein COR54_14615 [Elusimicrobia bacterium CG22_combo_CG10-13_8_21_14_all_63_91]PJA14760.1 MAG: hypothetical protein COX66_11785 [Elusimicrobia bacterium CG_4_10_14_0_2_um_filter_63_34]PJB26874.1 MAG: hypothetical protein CO113_01130 [Elusimicrobia bacterium CG_4_9_14_3_um_filter_62_55]
MLDAVKRIDIKLGFSCNNRCRFCVQGDKRERFQSRPLERVLTDLREGREGGACEVVLTGGEPTLQPTLLQAIREAKRLGYSNIQVQTNGRRFFYGNFCDELIEAGANEFAPAVHGSRPEIHDYLTRAPGSWAQTVGGIRNLKRRGMRVSVNTVVTRGNYRDLPEIARLLVKLRVRLFQFAFVHEVGEAGKNSRWLTARYSRCVPFIHEGLRIAREADTPSFTEAVPLCFMRGYENHVAERVMPRTKIHDAEGTIADYTRYRLGEGKTKGPPCETCRRENRCEGPWREYPEQFGWKEFVPFTEDPC